MARPGAVCLPGACYVCLTVLLASGWHASVSRTARQFFEERSHLGRNDFHRWNLKSTVPIATRWSTLGAAPAHAIGEREQLVWKPPSADKILPYALLGMTVVTGLVDAVSFLSLGRVFTANMTGNVVILAFASTGVPELSVARSLIALLAFLAGAAAGGRILADTSAETLIRPAIFTFGLEIVFLGGATLSAIGYNAVSSAHSFQLYAIIALTAVAMGMRNAAVRKLGVPDLTTTVLTLTITGLAADSSLARGSNPRWQRRVASILAMFAGAALGAIVVRHSVFMALAFAVAVSSVCSGALLHSFRLSSQAQASTVAHENTV